MVARGRSLNAPTKRLGRFVNRPYGWVRILVPISRKPLQSPRFYAILITERRWEYEKSIGYYEQRFLCSFCSAVFSLLFIFGLNVYHLYRFYLVFFLYDQHSFKCELSLCPTFLYHRNRFVHSVQNKRKIQRKLYYTALSLCLCAHRCFSACPINDMGQPIIPPKNISIPKNPRSCSEDFLTYKKAFVFLVEKSRKM